MGKAGIRHFRGVRPNRSADFRRPPFWTLKIPYELTCQVARRFQIRPEPRLAFILPLIAMLTTEPEMLQPDAFCEHPMAPPRTPLGDLTALPQTPYLVFRGPLRGVRGRGKKGRGGRGRERRGGERKGRRRAGREGKGRGGEGRRG